MKRRFGAMLVAASLGGAAWALYASGGMAPGPAAATDRPRPDSPFTHLPLPVTRPTRPAASGGHPPPRSGEVRNLTIVQLGNFTYDPVRGGDVPADVTALDGSKVRLTGYMMPTEEARGVTRFELVPSLKGCCFGQAPGVQHTVLIVGDAGTMIPYSSEPISVEGNLAVREIRDGGYVISLFEIWHPTVQIAPRQN